MTVLTPTANDQSPCSAGELAVLQMSEQPRFKLYGSILCVDPQKGITKLQATAAPIDIGSQPSISSAQVKGLSYMYAFVSPMLVWPQLMQLTWVTKQIASSYARLLLEP